MIQATSLRMPAEWARHERTVMSWPVNRDLWGSAFDQAKAEYAAVARAISRFEPVLLVVNPGDETDARDRCGGHVEILSAPLDDSWVRDSGPIIVRAASGERTGIHFRFNAYGGRFPFRRDARVASRVLERLGVPERRSQLILEGGSIAVDGEGTLITTEQCLLNANRNPGWTREEIEQELCEQLGVERVVWLRWGRIEDLHTDGHVDVVCMFVRPGVVVAQGCDDPANPNYQRLQANLRILRTATDARGRPFDIIELPIAPLVAFAGRSVLVGNINAYFVNGGILVPVAGYAAHDEAALAAFRRTCPEHEVMAVPATAIGLGGGGVHCITQQIPA